MAHNVRQEGPTSQESAIQTTTDPATDDLVLTVVEAARKLRIGRTKMFSLINRGKVKSVLIDGSRRVPVISLQEYVNKLLNVEQAA